MKKTVFLMVLFIGIACPRPANAQLFEKIGKVLETVDKVLGTDDKEKAAADTVSQAATYDTSGPFKGVWNLKSNNYEGEMKIDLYNKSVVGMTFDGDEVQCYGTINVTIVNGASIRIDECVVTDSQPKGNKATVKFISGRDGNTYQAVLTYNPSSKDITISDRQRLGDEEFGDCYVYDGLVFSK